MKKKPTIRDVATQAGVSIATVSKFINATQRFSSAVERRVQAAIDELHYHSNPLARSMITGKTGAIGVVILDIGNPHLEKHVVSAITLMKISATYAGFKKHLDKVMPIPKAQLTLDLNDIEDDDE